MTLSPRRQALAAALLAAIGIAAVVTAVMIRGGSEDAPIDARIEELIPADGSEVLLQQSVGIDLVDNPRFVVEFYVNGVRIPDDELIKATSVNRVVYQSGPGRSVESLAAERNCARAVFYPLAQEADSPTRGEHTWCFNAS